MAGLVRYFRNGLEPGSLCRQWLLLRCTLVQLNLQSTVDSFSERTSE